MGQRCLGNVKVGKDIGAERALKLRGRDLGVVVLVRIIDGELPGAGPALADAPRTAATAA